MNGAIALTRFDTVLLGIGLAALGGFLVYLWHLEGYSDDGSGPRSWLGVDYSPRGLWRRKISGAWGFVGIGLLIVAAGLFGS